MQRRNCRRLPSGTVRQAREGCQRPSRRTVGRAHPSLGADEARFRRGRAHQRTRTRTKAGCKSAMPRVASSDDTLPFEALSIGRPGCREALEEGMRCLVFRWSCPFAWPDLDFAPAALIYPCPARAVEEKRCARDLRKYTGGCCCKARHRLEKDSGFGTFYFAPMRAVHGSVGRFREGALVKSGWDICLRDG